MKAIFCLFLIFAITLSQDSDSELKKFNDDVTPLLASDICGAAGTISDSDDTKKCYDDQISKLDKLYLQANELIKKFDKDQNNKILAQQISAQIKTTLEEFNAKKILLTKDSKKENDQYSESAQIQNNAVSQTEIQTAATGAVDTFHQFIGNITSETQRIAHVCFKNILDNIPGSFCWKKGGDFGVLPSHCPAGYFRSLALCFKNCEPGYEFSGLFACRMGCDEGYTLKGLICYKSAFKWYVRKFYFPPSLTNFNDAVECPEGRYKAGAVCYKDCKKISLANCGWGACSLSTAQCVSSILHISVDFLLGLGKLLTFVGQQIDNPNLQNIAKEIEGALKAVGNQFVKKAFESLKAWIGDSSIKAFFVKTVANYTKNWIQNKFNKFLELPDVVQICGNVHTELKNQIVASNEPKIVAGLEGIVNQATEVISECATLDFKNGNTEDEAKCIKKVLTTASIYDPTGLATMFAAFAHPVCDLDK